MQGIKPIVFSVNHDVMPIISHTPEQLSSAKYNIQVEIACDCCGKTFTRIAKQLRADIKRGRKRFFCSELCRANGSITNGNSKPTKLTCERCGKEFERVNHRHGRSKHVYCSKSCSAKNNKNGMLAKGKHRPQQEKFYLRSYMNFELTIEGDSSAIERIRLPSVWLKIPCGGCGAILDRTEADIKQCKHGKPYCSKSCRMKHYNHHILERSSNQRSKAEDILASFIKTDFPDLEIVTNDRKFLPSGLEIDINIPSMRLAIELNGPVHYMPIYGEERLHKVQAKDAQKHLEIHQKGLTLIVLDISRLNSTKKQLEFLTKHYTDNIKPLLMEAPVGVSPTIA